MGLWGGQGGMGAGRSASALNASHALPLTRRDGEAKPLEHQPPGAGGVGKGNVLQVDAPVHRGQRAALSAARVDGRLPASMGA